MSTEATRPSLTQRLLRSAKRLFWIFLYLWALFALFALHESVVLAKHRISFEPFGLAFVNAWVMAKVMLIADDLNLGAHWFGKRPLVYRIVSRAVLFALVFIIVYAVEEVVVGLWSGKSVAESLHQAGTGSPAGVLSIAVVLSIALLPFFAFRAIDQALGTGTLRSLLLMRTAEEAAEPAQSRAATK